MQNLAIEFRLHALSGFCIALHLLKSRSRDVHSLRERQTHSPFTQETTYSFIGRKQGLAFWRAFGEVQALLPEKK